MPKTDRDKNKQAVRHTSEMQDIISAVPSRLLRWGITVFLLVLILMVGLAAFIRYPDTVKTTMVIHSTNLGGKIVNKMQASLVRLLARPGENVKAGQPLAYVSSTDSGNQVLRAPISGKLTYSGLLHEQEILTSGQDLFYIQPSNENFFGEMAVRQTDLGKVKEGQAVLIKLDGYPFEQYGILSGTVRYITNITNNDNAFLAEVAIHLSENNKARGIKLNPGMMANAEIVIQDASILQRIARNTFNNITNK